MKTLITLSAVALACSSGLTTATTFESYMAYSSADLDPSFEIRNYQRPAEWLSRDVPVSLEAVNRDNPEIGIGQWSYAPASVSLEELPSTFYAFDSGTGD